MSKTHKVSTFVEMDSLPWGTGNSLKASPGVRRKGEQRSFFSASRVGQGRGDSSFPHCTHQSLRVTERQNYRSFSSPQDSDPSPFCPFLPGSSLPLISGAVSILSSLCRAPISSPRHWTLEKAPPQLHKHTLTCCPKVKSLVSLFYGSYRELLMQVHKWNSLGFAEKLMIRRWR